MIDIQKYRKRLEELEKRLDERAETDMERGRDAKLDIPPDSGDKSISDVAVSDDFSEAELNAMLQQQVQDALRRIEAGTYGKCLIDGAPIPEKRLAAVPWAAYCAKHQALLEAAGREKTWTL
ncbi:MAG TPA: TraR/DksA family transcriptional regulator [Thermoanaerobaculia bacterium]|nr:TraR/DksA family transcriptional regulator [Thermoanaerobaculia bacterium]